MIKMIACDLDGTLVPHSQQITPRTLALIERLPDQGIEFVIATGRSYTNVLPLIEKYNWNLDYIMNNGHQCLLKSGEMRCYGMKEAALKRVCDLLTTYHYHITLYTEKGKYTFQDLDSYYADHLHHHVLRYGKLTEEDMQNPFFQREHYLKDCHQIEDAQTMIDQGLQVLKIDARCSNLENATHCLEQLRKMEEITLSSSYDFYMEIVGSDYDKGIMIEKLAKEKGILPEEIAVFGDSSNDLGMMNHFECSYAPANAIEMIQKAAHYHTLSCDQEGVYWGICEILRRNALEKTSASQETTEMAMNFDSKPVGINLK